MNQLQEIKDMREACQALYLATTPPVADDIKMKADRLIAKVEELEDKPITPREQELEAELDDLDDVLKVREKYIKELEADLKRCMRDRASRLRAMCEQAKHIAELEMEKPVIRLTLKDKELAEKDEVKAWLDECSALVSEEVERVLTELFIYGEAKVGG